MFRSRTTENLTLNYSRVVETETSDDDIDPRPSFPPMRVVETDGEAVDEITLPLPIVKCRAVSRARKAG